MLGINDLFLQSSVVVASRQTSLPWRKMWKYEFLQERNGKGVFLVCLGWLLSMWVWAGSGQASAPLGAGGAGHPLERPSQKPALGKLKCLILSTVTDNWYL